MAPDVEFQKHGEQGHIARWTVDALPFGEGVRIVNITSSPFNNYENLIHVISKVNLQKYWTNQGSHADEVRGINVILAQQHKADA